LGGVMCGASLQENHCWIDARSISESMVWAYVADDAMELCNNSEDREKSEIIAFATN